MLAVVAGVVTQERQHGHRVAAHRANGAFRCRGLFTAQGGADEYTVLPVAGLRHQRHRRLAPATEQDRRNRHALGIIPFRCQRGALRHRRAVARVRMRRRVIRGGRPVLSLPVDQMFRFTLQALPPHVTIVGQRHVGENGVSAGDRLHRVRVGTPVGARRHPEESELRVHRVQPTVLTETHPGDVVTEGFGAPARDCRLQHREVCLAAGRRERRHHVVGLVLRGDEFEDQHVLSEPALIAGHHRGNPQRVALLSQQRVTAVAGAVTPNLPGLREVADVFGLAAGPRDVGLSRFQWRAHRMQCLDEEPVIADFRKRRRAHPGHGPHRDHDVLRIGDLHTQLGIIRAEGSHAERHHIHGATAHTSPVQLGHRGAHLLGRHPVVGRTGVGLTSRADERPGLNAGHIRGLRAGQVGTRLVGCTQRGEGAGSHELVAQALVFRHRTVREHDPVRLREFGDLADPAEQAGVLGRCVVQTGDGR